MLQDRLICRLVRRSMRKDLGRYVCRSVVGAVGTSVVQLGLNVSPRPGTTAHRRGALGYGSARLPASPLYNGGMGHRFLESHLAVWEPRPTGVAGSTISHHFPQRLATALVTASRTASCRIAHWN
jgi:hypothetical protein